jgi:hypothetical protein
LDARAAARLSSSAYWYYVLGLLTLCYVANVMDRSSILAASLQSIKREFGAHVLPQSVKPLLNESGAM